MTRRETLKKYIKDDEALTPLIDEVLFLEGQLDELKKLPFLKIHPNNPQLQKATPASKQYKELLQQYNNCIKILAKASGHEFDEDDSPLREWAKKRNEAVKLC